MTLLSPSVQPCQEVPPGWAPTQGHPAGAQNSTSRTRLCKQREKGAPRGEEALFRTSPQNQASPAPVWAGCRAHPMGPECLRAGKDCRAHPFTVGQCAAIQMGELVMNGGNCSSLCPVSRRRQKTLLPRQTMPLCGRQRPAARTSLALCRPPIAGLWSHSQWHPLPVGDPGRFLRQARERRDEPPSLRPRARHMATPVQHLRRGLPTVGRGPAAGGSASLLHGLSQQQPGGESWGHQ